MFIYLFVFSISIVLIYMAEHSNKKDYKFLIFIALIIPCILSGLRSNSIGTDTSWYPLQIFNASQSSNNLINFFDMVIFDSPQLGLLYKVSSFEFGFDILVYIIQHITNNFQVLLFIIQLLINCLIYCGIKKYKFIRENKMIWLSMLMFYFLFYNLSLNMIRQMIAIAFIFYGISSLINDNKKKILKCIISVILAFLFHKSGLFGIIIIAGYYFYKFLSKRTGKFSKNNFATNFTLLSILLFCFLILMIPGVFKNIISLILPKSSYAYYIGNQYSISRSIIFSIPAIILFIFNYKNYKENILYGFLTFNYILSMICFQLTSDSMQYNATRIGYYFQIYSLVSIPLLKDLSSKKIYKQLITFFIIIYCLVYWYWKYIYRNYGDTYPYLFFNY